MNLKKSFLSVFLVISVSVLLFPQAGGRGRPGQGGGSMSLISTAEISRRSNYITVAGRMAPESRISHKATVSGYVGEVFVSEGDSVNVGDHLFRIDRNDVGQSYKPVYIDARISGRVSVVSVQDQGEISAGGEGVTVVSSSAFTVDALISDKDAFKVRIGQSVTGFNPDGLSVKGTLEGRSQEPDYDTGLFSLKFRFPGKSGFYIGSFIMIKLPTDSSEGVFVSRAALVRRYGSYYIWTVDAESKLTAVEVVPGVEYGEDVLIMSGLEAGTMYLSEPTGREREGTVVERGAGS